jgi:hypothetical protein
LQLYCCIILQQRFYVIFTLRSAVSENEKIASKQKKSKSNAERIQRSVA